MNIRLLALCGLLSVMMGCGSSPKAPVISPAIDMYHTTDDGRMVRYGVSEFGTLRFAGGYPARESQWSWTGHISEAQGAKLGSIVTSGAWLTAPPTGGADDDADTWEVTVRLGDSYRRFTAYGSPTSIVQAWSVLQDAGKARLQQDLDRLPTADVDLLMQRRKAESGTE